MAIVAVAIVTITRYRPVMLQESGEQVQQEREHDLSHPFVPEVTELSETGTGPAFTVPGSGTPTGQDEVSGLVLTAQSRVELVQSLRRRAVVLLPGRLHGRTNQVEGPGEPEAAASALEDLRVVQMLMDSIGFELDALRQSSGQVELAASGIEASRRYDVSMVRDALDHVIAEMEIQQRDLLRAVENLREAATAAEAGDDAMADIKSGVAVSYRLQSDRRTRMVARRTETLNAAVRRLVNR